MEESVGDIVCIQHSFVEYASASHDALDKTAAHLLLSPESQSPTSTKESGMSIYHLQLLDPWGPSVRHHYTTNRAASLHHWPLVTAHRFTPTLTIGAWGIYQTSSAHARHSSMLLAVGNWGPMEPMQLY